MTPARRRALVAAAALLLAALSIFMLERPRSGPVVAISPFSGAVTPDQPQNLLMISGAWEGRLRDFALAAVRQVDPEAGEDQVVRDSDLRRAALVAPGVEHVGILYSRTALRAARGWRWA